MNKLLLALLVIVKGGGLSAQQPPGAGEALLRVNAARFDAMVRNDLSGLDTLLAPELTYIHSDGVIESKAEVLSTLKNGRIRYQAIQPDNQVVRFYGPITGVITGRSWMRVKVADKVLRFRIRFTALYRRNGPRWVLAAWQATRLPPP